MYYGKLLGAAEKSSESTKTRLPDAGCHHTKRICRNESTTEPIQRMKHNVNIMILRKPVRIPPWHGPGTSKSREPLIVCQSKKGQESLGLFQVGQVHFSCSRVHIQPWLLAIKHVQLASAFSQGPRGLHAIRRTGCHKHRHWHCQCIHSSHPEWSW